MTNVREICSYFVDLKDKNKISADVSEYQIFKSLKTKQKKNFFSLKKRISTTSNSNLSLRLNSTELFRFSAYVSKHIFLDTGLCFLPSLCLHMLQTLTEAPVLSPCAWYVSARSKFSKSRIPPEVRINLESIMLYICKVISNTQSM